jgi:hypothetical protein
VAAIPADHPYRALCLSNLGNVLQTRFGHTSDLADLDRAVEVGKQAVAAIPADHPYRAGRLSNLGNALRIRFERTRVLADLDWAMEVSRGAALMGTAPASVRTQAARSWGAWAATRQDWGQAVEGYATAVNLLGLVAPRSVSRGDQEHQLSELTGLGSDAAACCLQAGQVERAVELWEQGRGVLFSQALDTRTDLTRLTEQHPKLAERFTRLRDELDSAPDLDGVAGLAGTGNTIRAGGGDSAVRGDIDRRRDLAKQFDQTITEIRSRSGFDRFLLPPPVSELLPAAAHGPVVLVNVSDIRSDALILTATGVEVVPLPGLSPPAVRDQVEAFMTTLENAQNLGVDPQVRARAEAQLGQRLGWLWTTITGPVLDRLGITGRPRPGQRWPRVWWCPSGLLAFLPLHAAGRHDTRFDPDPDTVIDRVISSYTPTIRALGHARRPRTAGARVASAPTGVSPAPGGAGRVVVVAMPHTPAAGDLPGAAAEAELLRSLLPGQVKMLDGPQATHNSVTAVLPRFPWAHFACHGSSDPANPSASHLLLNDYQRRPLTVVDVTRLRLDRAELAFLSACSTARTGTQLADEAIHLAAAFQLAGYRHVIATLWPIGDRPAVRIATDIYPTLVANDTADTAAEALHAATRRLRAIQLDRPSTWAAHLHNGA